MKIKVISENVMNIEKNEINVLIKSSEDNEEIKNLIKYINNYENFIAKKFLLMMKIKLLK